VVEKEGIKYITFGIFTGTGLVKHAFTTRAGGVSAGPFRSLNMALHVGDDPVAVVENRKMVCSALGAGLEDLVAGQQVHGTTVLAVSAAHRGRGSLSREDAIPGADGLITKETGLLLASYYADCVPVMLLDPVGRAIGLAHAGWKGTVGRIAGKAVQSMVYNYGTNPRDCLAVVGPSIGPCCYEVDAPVVEMVKESFDRWPEMVKQTGPGRWRLNLWLANRIALAEAGVRVEHIAEPGLCTNCNRELFFSYRGQSGACGRMASLMMLK
jgi:YfiH family protein